MKPIIKSTVYGTSLMTLYSYLVSKKKPKDFREPELLAILLERILPIDSKSAKMSGWTVHYLIGLLLVMVYLELWESGVTKPTYRNGAILGGISGFIGVLGWKVMLSMHPAPPKLQVRKFYQQLIVAHIIFGIGATYGYNSSK